MLERKVKKYSSQFNRYHIPYTIEIQLSQTMLYEMDYKIYNDSVLVLCYVLE